MQMLQQITRRPAYLLAAAIALATLLITMACGDSSDGHENERAISDASQSQDYHAPASGQNVKTTATPADPDPVVINMAIAARASNLSRDDLQVKKGDTLNINFTADEMGEIHLHGYDLTAPVSPDSPGTLTFVAETAGAFGINFHVFGDAGGESGGSHGGHHHGAGVPDQVVSETPLSLAITAAADAAGGVDVHIVTEGFRFAPDLVDQAHTPGAGHAHIYMDDVKLGRVFEADYHIESAPPGEREIRVSLNTNDHSELVYDGRKLEATVIVNVPDVGQSHAARIPTARAMTTAARTATAPTTTTVTRTATAARR